MSDELTLYVANTAYGPSNPAIMTFHFDAANLQTPEQKLAQCIAFVQYCSIAANTYFDSARWKVSGGSGSAPMTWPATEYNALQAGDPDLDALTGWGDTTGTGTLTPIGTSLCLSLYSATPGRKKTGRSYTPFVRTAAIGGDGLVLATPRGFAEKGYRDYVIGTGSNPAADVLDPVVQSRTAGQALILTPICSLKPARLKTRTR